MTKRGLLNRVIFAGLLALVLAATPLLSAAASLDEAKAAGLVGEQSDGYLGVVSADGGAGVQELVQRINGERRKRYLEIANRTGAALRDVELLAGKTAIERTASGGFVRSADGRWQKKP